jgi:hypothetical protein
MKYCHSSLTVLYRMVHCNWYGLHIIGVTPEKLATFRVLTQNRNGLFLKVPEGEFICSLEFYLQREIILARIITAVIGRGVLQYSNISKWYDMAIVEVFFDVQNLYILGCK